MDLQLEFVGDLNLFLGLTCASAGTAGLLFVASLLRAIALGAKTKGSFPGENLAVTTVLGVALFVVGGLSFLLGLSAIAGMSTCVSVLPTLENKDADLYRQIIDWANTWSAPLAASGLLATLVVWVVIELTVALAAFLQERRKSKRIHEVLTRLESSATNDYEDW